MVVNISDHGVQADIMFVIEGTAINGAYLHDLKTNYLIPTLEYFCQGTIEDRDYVCESTSTLYGLVVYHAADILPRPSSDCYGPYSSPQRLLTALEKLELIGGKGESHANIAEGLATALQAFEDLQSKREGTNILAQKHCILVCNSPPYLMPVMESPTYAGHTTDQLAALLNERTINLSILSPRKIPAMYKLFEKAGGDLSQSQSKNYAKDPRHLVLLKGFSLKERPISPTGGSLQTTNSNLPIPSLPSPIANVGSPMTTTNQMPQSQQHPAPPPPGYRPQQQPQVMGQQQPQVQQPAIAGRPQFQPQVPPVYHTNMRQPGPRWPMAPPQNRTFMNTQGNATTGQSSALIAQLTQPPTQFSPHRLEGSGLNQQMTPQQQQQMRMNAMNIGSQSGPLGPGSIGTVPMANQGVMGQQGNMTSQNLMGNAGGMIPPGLMGQNMPNQNTANMSAPGNQSLQGPNSGNMQGAVGNSQQGIQNQAAGNVQGQAGSTMVQTPSGNQGINTQTMSGMTTTPNQAMQASQNQPGNQQQQTQQQTQPQQTSSQSALAAPSTGLPVRERHTIWQGVLEWLEKAKSPNDNQKVTRNVPCQVSCTPKEGEPDLKADSWPQKLIMQLMPKQLIGNIGGAYLKNSTSVLFHPQHCEALESLTKVMSSGFAGCVHFTSVPSPAQCEIKVLILLYTVEKRAYLGFIPNDQVAFVERLRKVIQQQKTTQAILRQGQVGGPSNAPVGPGSGPQPLPGPMPTNPPVSTSGAATSQGGIMMSQTNTMAMGGGQISQPQEGHMGGVQGMGTGPGQGRGAPGPVMGGPPQRPPFNRIEAARQQNLAKIQQLQQTLEAAQQQEIHYKSQLEIMSQMQIQQLQQNLEQAQQQEVHYQAQMEQEQKLQLRAQLQQIQQQRQMAPQQMQQQPNNNPQQQNQPRMLRPQLSSNPGLRHLLQQQQQPPFRQHVLGMGQMQQRPGAPGGIGQQNQQQFDDVSNFDFLN